MPENVFEIKKSADTLLNAGISKYNAHERVSALILFDLALGLFQEIGDGRAQEVQGWINRATQLAA